MDADERTLREACADVQRHLAAVGYFEVSIERPAPVYHALESGLSRELFLIAREHGVPAGALLDEWVQEKVEL